MNDFSGFHPSSIAGYLHGRETLSERNISLLLSARSINPETLKLDPSRVHVWIVTLHEPETLTAATESFLESPIEMAVVSPDLEGPASLSQAPQLAFLRSDTLRIVLLRKLFPAKMSKIPLSQRAGTPWWIRPSLIPGQG